VTHNQVVHVYFNGQYDADYVDWAASEPASYGSRLTQASPFGGEMISLMPL